MIGRTVFGALIVISILAVSGCLEKEEARKVDLSEKVAVGIPTEDEALKIGVAAIVSPQETFVYYQEVFNYVSQRIDKPVKLVQRKTYREMNELIKKGYVDAAFVCSGVYAKGRDRYGMELLVAPVVNGETVYYSYTIVPENSPVASFEQLRDKSFAFSDPLSNTGYGVPNHILVEMGETPDTFFRLYIFTYSHDKSIKAVAERLVDAANVDSLIWDYINSTNPTLTSKTRIIIKSPPYGIPPVVVSKNIDPELKKRLRDILLHMHEDEEGRAILGKIMIDKFVLIDDSAYDSTRETYNVAEKNEAG